MAIRPRLLSVFMGFLPLCVEIYLRFTCITLCIQKNISSSVMYIDILPSVTSGKNVTTELKSDCKIGICLCCLAPSYVSSGWELLSLHFKKIHLFYFWDYWANRLAEEWAGIYLVLAVSHYIVIWILITQLVLAKVGKNQLKFSLKSEVWATRKSLFLLLHRA